LGYLRDIGWLVGGAESGQYRSRRSSQADSRVDDHQRRSVRQGGDQQVSVDGYIDLPKVGRFERHPLDAVS